MADDQRTLEIQILTKYLGAGAAAAIVDQNRLAGSTRDLTQETEKAAEATGHSNLTHRALARTLGELNRVIPGLGTAAEFLAHGLQAEAASAEGAAVANQKLLVSMGELAVVFLAIEAAVEYWGMYKAASEAAAKSTAEQFDKIRQATHEALVENEDYEKSINKAFASHDKYADALSREEEVLREQFKIKRDLLHLQEEEEMSKATTPEERKAIKDRYSSAEAGLDAAADAGKLQILRQTIDEIQGLFDKNEQERHALNDLKPQAATNPALLDQINARLKILDEENVGLAEKLGKYREQAATDTQVGGIRDQGRSEAERRGLAEEQEDIGIDIANNISSGKGASAAQQKYLVELASKIAGHTVNLAEAVQVMETAAHAPAAFVEQVNRAAKALSSFSPAQVKNLRAAVDNLEKQVEHATQMASQALANSNLH